MSICPVCGQINLFSGRDKSGFCPVCTSSFRLLPNDKIEVRLKL